MNRKIAEAVLAEVKARHDVRPEESGPELYDSGHEELPEGAWTIMWEEGPFDWAINYQTEVPGVFAEAGFSFSLNIYDD